MTLYVRRTAASSNHLAKNPGHKFQHLTIA